MNTDFERQTYLVTGPTSGIGREAALALANYGSVILVGRNLQKLQEIESGIKQKGQKAVSVVCDLSDPVSVQKAANEIVALRLPITGLLNNAGIIEVNSPTKNALGWDMTFATNFLGPFMLTELLAPHLPDGAQVLFVVSAVEDPERKPAKLVGMRGGRYISAEACARGEWKPGGAPSVGMNSYATSKQALLAATLAFARETPRLRINGVEPGLTPGSGLSRDTNALVGALFNYVISKMPPFAQYRSTPEQAGRVLTKLLTNANSQETGVYYDEKGQPMIGSDLVRDPAFQERVVAETRAFLSKSLSGYQSSIV